MSDTSQIIEVDEDLVEIARQIVGAGKSEADWAELEADDYFQIRRWCGGFDADENAFTFSYYATDGVEYWYQFDLKEAERIADGSIRTLKAELAE